MKNQLITTLIACMAYTFSYGQCDTGSEPECQCETAEVLCSIGELDGFSSSMSSFQHPDDGPTPFCGPQTQTNNPTWFAFIAWCSDITMEVSFEDCTTVNNTEGAQLAVYTDCSFSEQIDCDSECNDNSTAVVDMQGLTIGESYYVMLDGCFGSACDYEVSVSPTDCDEFIEDWEEPVTEDLVVCLGQEVIYDVDELQGATSWHWFLDSDEIETTDLASYTIVWDTEGMYELCVDVSNICLDVDEDPLQNCVMITVGNPDAGEIEISESPECPNEFMEISVNNYNMGPTYEQYVIITNMEGEVVQIVSGNPIFDFTWPTCGMFNVYSLNFPEAEEELEVPDIGDDYFGSDCMLFCCNETTSMLEFVDEEAPEFEDDVDDVTIACHLLLEVLDLDDLESIDVEDNCAEDFEVLGMETIMADTCNGGTIVRQWMFADDCGNEVSQTQTITILPLQMPQFVNPPSDTSMTNLQFQNFVIPQLQYSNSDTLSCLIEGMLTPTVEDNRNGCGGFLILNYSYTDPCGRELMASQRIDIITDAAVSDTVLNICDYDMTRIATITRSELNSLIAGDTTGLTIQYYPTEIDMAGGSNELVLPVNSDQLPEPNIYAAIVDASGCRYELIIQIRFNDIPEFSLVAVDESCLDFNDGSISVNLISNISGYTLVQGSDTLSSLFVDQLADGNYHFTLIDSLGCIAEDSATVNNGILIEFINVFESCDNNDTGTDDTDDFYEIEFLVTGGSGQFQLDVSTVINQGIYNYDETIVITLPADGNTIDLVATDVEDVCIAEYTTNALSPCSNECAISLELLEYTCNNNGTPLDASDDFYDFIINASSINGGSQSSYRVIVDGNPEFTFMYNQDEIFQLPASEEIADIRLEDLDITTCFTSVLTDPLEACSNLCQLNINLIDVVCVDPFTPADNDDDLFDVTIQVEGINASSGFIIEGFAGIFNYNEDIILTDNPIAVGDLNLTVTDSEDQSCFSEILVMAPAPCSSPCDVELLQLNILECNDNMTGAISDDDFFFIEIEIASLLGTGTEYLVQDELGNVYDQLSYNAVNVIGPFPADASSIQLSLEDPENASCFLDFEISQESCSECIHDLDLNAGTLLLDCETTSTIIESMTDNTAVSYSWTGPGGITGSSDQLSVSQAGEYTLVVIYSDGCELSDNIFIDVSQDMPVSHAGQDQIINCENTSVILDGSQSSYGSDVSFSWFDSDNNIISQSLQFEVDVAGIYGFQVTDNSNSCESEIDFVEVFEFLDEPVAIIYAEPASILDCNIMSIRLTYEEEENVIYTWLLNNQELIREELIIEEQQEVGLIALDTISECESETLLNITDLEVYPSINMLDIGSLDCISNEACVAVSVDALNELAYVWLDSGGNIISEGEAQACFQDAGTYTLEITDIENGCQNSESFSIDAPPMPELNLPASITLVNEESVSISAQLNLDLALIDQISWQGNAILSCYDCLQTEILEAQDSTVMNLLVTTVDGCSTSAEILIRVKRIPKIFVPNIFSLSSGDRFTIRTSSDIRRIEDIYIYDRWGNLIFTNSQFEPNEESESWDGRRGDREVEQGVYVYVFRYMTDEGIVSQYGSVTLIK